MKKKFLTPELIILTLGEITVSLIVVLLYLLCDALFDVELLTFSYRVITGALLGSAVTVLNHLFLTVSVNRAIDNYLALRGNTEMDEETAAKFAKENSMAIQNAIKTSFIVRTVSMLATLIIAFVIDWFAPLATVIPLLMLRPLLYLSELIKRKFTKSPADGAIYGTAEEIKEEKESDE